MKRVANTGKPPVIVPVVVVAIDVHLALVIPAVEIRIAIVQNAIFTTTP